MKRDMELIRGLLGEIEDTPPNSVYETENSSLGMSLAVLGEHMRLLEEAGFVRKVSREMSGNALCHGLTWAGHEFLNATRSDTIWQRMKELLRKRAMSVTSVPLHVVQEVCVSIARSELGLD